VKTASMMLFNVSVYFFCSYWYCNFYNDKYTFLINLYCISTPLAQFHRQGGPLTIGKPGIGWSYYIILVGVEQRGPKK
jgi:hypothetical protein